jgi:ribosome-associated heat shock protein Hsp15
VQGGHVRVNGERARAATRVRVGDEIVLVRQALKYEMTVIDIPERRGPASEAKACYEELPESIEHRQQAVSELRRDRMQMPMTRGKPDKHTRRQLRDRKGR